MECNFCSEEATIFFTKVADGNLNKISLCESCAKDPAILAEHDLQQALSPSALIPQIFEEAPSDGELLSCRCGFTLKDLQSVGRLGCSTCYKTFGPIILERIDAVQRGTQHTGKQIEIELTDELVQEKLAKLNKELSGLIEAEEFEKAAAVRDEIENLNNQLV